MTMLNTGAEGDLIAKNRCRFRGAAAEHRDGRPLITFTEALGLSEVIDPPMARPCSWRRRAGCASVGCSG